jgi:hypothetical protein
MLGNFKPVAYDPYRRSRKRGLPRWLVLLLAGIAIGAGSAVLVQERYLPPRLSADASAQLQASYAQADAERQRLAVELRAATQKLDATAAEKKSLADELGDTRRLADDLRGDLATVIGSLPPDPRGGAVEIRAARFAAKGDALAYDVTLSRPRAGAKPISGVLQFVVAGASVRGDANVTSKPVPVSLGAYEVLRGNVDLPDGFKPRQTTIQVLDKPGGARLGMRVINIE